MTGGRLDEVKSDLMRQCQRRIDQLTTLFASAGGPGIFEHAEKVIGSGLDAAEWLTTSQIGLGGAVPSVVATGPEGCERVKTYLKQIEYGAYP